jgi:SpoVK/Ycf46/Vps4 family AAA+-type ATPase
VATNRLRSFDAAVTRPGRFDALLFVGTPNLESRVRRLGERLPAAAAAATARPQITDVFRQVLIERWDKEARFCSFAENEALINFAREEARGNGNTPVDSTALKAKLGSKLDSLLKTATIQGQVREEYVVSEG